MVERTPILNFVTHLFLVCGILVTGFPVYVAIVAATQTVEHVNTLPMTLLPGSELIANLQAAWAREDLGRQLINSMVMAGGITVGKISISILSAYAIVYFDFRFRTAAFWLVFFSLMLPVEVRIVPTFQVAANALLPLVWVGKALGLDSLAGWLTGRAVSFDVKLSLLNSYPGLIFPLIASATATFLFRQFFLTLPNELCEAAKIDGAGPLRFFKDIALPLSWTNIAALSVILFIYGWNQYLWPLLVTTRQDYMTIVVGLSALMPQAEQMPEWNVTMAGALLSMLPPIVVVIVLQQWFVKGLVETEK